MLAEHYAGVAIDQLKRGKRKLALTYLKLACLQPNVTDYIYLLRIEAEVWEKEWLSALNYIDMVRLAKLSTSEQRRYYWACARLFNALKKKRSALSCFNLAMETRGSEQWKRMMRELRNALPLAGRVTKQFSFPGGFANRGCILYVANKRAEFITKFYKESDNYIREAFFYKYCAPLISSSFVLRPVYFSGHKSPFKAICFPYISQGEGSVEPIEIIPHDKVLELVERLGNASFYADKLIVREFGGREFGGRELESSGGLSGIKIDRFRVPTLPLSLGRNMVNLRNAFFNAHYPTSYKYLRLMLIFSLRRIKHLRNVSVSSKQYALDIGFFFLKKAHFNKLLSDDTLDSGFCHTDLKADNVILSSDGEFFVIDWGNLSFGPLGYDIATFVSEANLKYSEVQFFLHDQFPFSAHNKIFTWWACYFHCLRNLEKKKENRIGAALLFLRNNIMSIDNW
ncbi:phosphotransferase [Halomonas venusta]|uniref:phosphotransferase family protein n=1 Tax=Vreelandella venusta TaxID=44935 RepID=UPI00295F5386|nr:phosphotransferase [Halomonas venusta]MDW0359753.1 phosphotransferase [Halomonas venusta]